MTASATLDGGVVGATERTFPCLDGARIVAATAVLLLHVAGTTGADFSSPFGRALSHLDVGVAVFFVLSGFLLFRPFALAAVRGQRAPGTGAYLWRRALRILPAYWVTVAAALLLLQVNEGTNGTTWLRHLALVQIYDEWWFAQGLDHVWSLCVEVSFYALLPLLAALLVRLSRRRAGRPWPTMVVLCSMAVIGPAYVYASWVWRTSTPANLWLPAFAGWFAGGMALAIFTTADPDWRPVRVARALGTNLGRCWTGAAALFALACTQLTGPVGLEAPTPAEATIKNVLYMGIAVCFVLPLVMAGPDEGPVRRVLSSRPARLLGEVSYGVFLMHVLLLLGLYETLGAQPLTGSFWLLAPILWASSVAAATLLYFTVERPVRRWRSVIPDRSRTAGAASESVGRPSGQSRAAQPGRHDGEAVERRGTESADRVFDLVRSGRTEELVDRLDAGVPVDLTDEEGDTLLIKAAARGHAATVAALIARGADHSRTNERGQTALSLAVIRQSPEAAGHLLAAGADPDAGRPSARATAEQFGLPQMTALLEAARR